MSGADGERGRQKEGAQRASVVQLVRRGQHQRREALHPRPPPLGVLGELRALWHPREASVGDMHVAQERPPFQPSCNRPHVPRREGRDDRQAVRLELLEVREPAHERREPVVCEAQDAADTERGERGGVHRDRLQAEVGKLGTPRDIEVGAGDVSPTTVLSGTSSIDAESCTSRWPSGHVAHAC